MKLSVPLAIMASITHLLAYVLYNSAALRGVSQPNLVPWIIFGFVAALNATTYKAQTGDKVKAMLSMAGTIASISTLCVVLAMGGTLRGISTMNIVTLAIGIVAIAVWKFGSSNTESAKYANYWMLVAATAGFVPFWNTLWSNPSSEAKLPWFLWTLSTTLGVVVVVMRKEGRKSSDFVMPVVLMILHGSTWILTLR